MLPSLDMVTSHKTLRPSAIAAAAAIFVMEDASS
jgi:hypothetical protein